MTGSALLLDRVSKRFGQVEVLSDLSIAVSAGEFVAIVGPSGCGKTTLLNIISGFDKPSSGRVEAAGRMRMVYQQDSLFPWLTVRENIALGLRDVKDRERLDRQLSDLLELIRLAGFKNHYPHQLSGGMRQRVELARAIAGTSDILLLDEPFSSLDYLTRLRMRQELAQILEARPRTVVMVTHDIEEAAQLADRIFVLSDRPGRIALMHKLPPGRLRHPTHPAVLQALDLIFTALGFGKDSALSYEPSNSVFDNVS